MVKTAMPLSMLVAASLMLAGSNARPILSGTHVNSRQLMSIRYLKEGSSGDYGYGYGENIAPMGDLGSVAPTTAPELMNEYQPMGDLGSVPPTTAPELTTEYSPMGEPAVHVIAASPPALENDYSPGMSLDEKADKVAAQVMEEYDLGSPGSQPPSGDLGSQPPNSDFVIGPIITDVNPVNPAEVLNKLGTCMDYNNDGFLDFTDIRDVIEARVSKDDIQKILEELDANKDGEVTFDDIVTKVMTFQTINDTQKLVDFVNKIDIESLCNVTLYDTLSAVGKLLELPAKDIVLTLFNALDVNKDDKVPYKGIKEQLTAFGVPQSWLDKLAEVDVDGDEALSSSEVTSFIQQYDLESLLAKLIALISGGN